jgi:hypothetical protein
MFINVDKYTNTYIQIYFLNNDIDAYTEMYI